METTTSASHLGGPVGRLGLETPTDGAVDPVEQRHVSVEVPDDDVDHAIPIDIPESVRPERAITAVTPDLRTGTRIDDSHDVPRVAEEDQFLGRVAIQVGDGLNLPGQLVISMDRDSRQAKPPDRSRGVVIHSIRSTGDDDVRDPVPVEVGHDGAVQRSVGVEQRRNGSSHVDEEKGFAHRHHDVPTSVASDVTERQRLLARRAGVEDRERIR